MGSSITDKVAATGILLLFSFVALCVYIIIGEDLERRAWLEATSTLPLYQTDDICASVETGHVLHCGNCGSCSNPHDIRIFKETAQTLTGIMSLCSFEGFFLGSPHTKQCLLAQSNLTDSCAQCWIANALCTQRHCTRTCFHQRFFSFLPTFQSWNDPRLSPCIACDEKFCGPEFVACAGANRRRVGVVSDLQRDMNLELCYKTDWDYVMSMSHDPDLLVKTTTPKRLNDNSSGSSEDDSVACNADDDQHQQLCRCSEI
ncbi:hypothetical protein ACA910_005779 [Epithemia clementina (nom. ined.)]